MTDLERMEQELFSAVEDCFDREGECDRNKLEPLIRAHAATLVAGAYEACAKACLNNVLSEKQMNDEPNLHVGEMCLRLCHERDAAVIRSLTPTAAAKELSRRTAEAERKGRLAEARLWCTAILTGVLVDPRVQKWARERIAELSSPPAEETEL